jgi:hypothetical protein
MAELYRGRGQIAALAFQFPPHGGRSNEFMSIRFITLIAVLSLVGGCATHKPQASTPKTEHFFPIMSWEIPPRCDNFSDAKHGLKSLKDCGFTVAGFVRPEHLQECERLGLKAIVSRPGKPEPWEKMPDERLQATAEKLIADGRDSPAVIGYFITDEPGVQKFPALARAAKVVHDRKPGRIAYINLYPDYATLGAPDLSQLGTPNYREYLERFVGEVKPDVISYDNYRVQFSNDLQNEKVAASYFTNLMSARSVALEHNLPFWVINSSNQIRKFTPVPSPANLLFQAYTSLCAGAHGLTWYTYYSGRYGYSPVDDSGRITASWSYLKMVNDQVKVIGPMMLRLKSTGVYAASHAPVPQIPELPGKLVEKIDSPTPILVGEFDGPEGEKWVMLVNQSLRESAKPKITWVGQTGKDVRVVSPVDGSLRPIEPDQSLWLTAGQGALLRLQ